MFRHEQPHKFDPVYVEHSMKLNKRFAEVIMAKKGHCLNYVALVTLFIVLSNAFSHGVLS